MFGLRAPVITVGVILVIVKVTVVVCIMRDVTGDDLVEVSGAIIKNMRGGGEMVWMVGWRSKGWG